METANKVKHSKKAVLGMSKSYNLYVVNCTASPGWNIGQPVRMGIYCQHDHFESYPTPIPPEKQWSVHYEIEFLGNMADQRTG